MFSAPSLLNLCIYFSFSSGDNTIFVFFGWGFLLHLGVVRFFNGSNKHHSFPRYRSYEKIPPQNLFISGILKFFRCHNRNISLENFWYNNPIFYTHLMFIVDFFFMFIFKLFIGTLFNHILFSPKSSSMSIMRRFYLPFFIFNNV